MSKLQKKPSVEKVRDLYGSIEHCMTRKFFEMVSFFLQFFFFFWFIAFCNKLRESQRTTKRQQKHSWISGRVPVIQDFQFTWSRCKSYNFIVFRAVQTVLLLFFINQQNYFSLFNFDVLRTSFDLRM